MEEYSEQYNQMPEEENQYEEDVKIFESKYDNEFLGLLNEISMRMPNHSKQDIFKIKSWINILTIPCDTDETKKNRNLYGIKLLNQMINGKLEEPFIRQANGVNDLKWLSPIDVKAELTKKFYDEIKLEEIENSGIQQQKKFLTKNPNIAFKIKTQSNSDTKNNIPDNNNNINNNNYISNFNYNDNNNDDININVNDRPYYNEVNNYTSFPMDNRQMPIQQKVNRPNNNKTGGFTSINNKIKNSKINNDKIKLINIIRDLEQKCIERDEIIEFQNKQIEQIKNRINFIQNLQNNNQNN